MIRKFRVENCGKWIECPLLNWSKPLLVRMLWKCTTWLQVILSYSYGWRWIISYFLSCSIESIRTGAVSTRLATPRCKFARSPNGLRCVSGWFKFRAVMAPFLVVQAQVKEKLYETRKEKRFFIVQCRNMWDLPPKGLARAEPLTRFRVTGFSWIYQTMLRVVVLKESESILQTSHDHRTSVPFLLSLAARRHLPSLFATIVFFQLLRVIRLAPPATARRWTALLECALSDVNM